MSNKIKMLVIGSDYTGCFKFRSCDPHVYIQEHYSDEFDIDIVHVPDLPRENLDKFFSQYDLIHIHKQLDRNCDLMKMIKFLGIPVILDIDDHYNLGNDHPMSLTARKERWAEPIINHLKMADYVTTTTPIFAKTLRKHNKNVHVFPNAINPEEPQYIQTKTKSDKLRVGIICGSSHLHDIELLGDLVNRVADNVQIVLCGFDTNGTITTYNQATGEKTQRPIRPEESVWFTYEKILTGNYAQISPGHKDFLMKFMKNVDDPFVNEKYRRMWTRDITKYATHYENVDVLLAPLKENDFNSVKSQLKTIEAGFTHTALIAQNFGAYTIDSIPMIEKGGKINENGNSLLVDSRKNHKDWAKYINKLAANPDMVKKLQDNLYNYVKDKYSIEAVCKDRVEFYKKITGRE
jgi:glycosyltransferase involved in cell wall biosynthesis